MSSANSRVLIALAIAVLAIGALFVLDPSGTAAKALAYLGSRVGALQDHVAFMTGMVLVLGIEVMAMGYEKSSVPRLLHPSRSGWMDILIFLLNQVGLIGALSWIFTFSADSTLSAWFRAHLPANLLHLGNPWLQYIWFLLVTDFTRYCMHYAGHKLGWWWQLHAFHHAATEMNVITTNRGHPAELGLQIIILAIPTAMLGGTMADYFLVSVLFAMHAGLTHSMLPWDFGWIGRWVVYSPIGHRIHHSYLPEHIDKNFGMLFVFWDRLFGTWYDGKVVNETIGIEHNPYNHDNAAADLVACAVRFYGALIAPIRRLFA